MSYKDWVKQQPVYQYPLEIVVTTVFGHSVKSPPHVYMFNKVSQEYSNLISTERLKERRKL